MLTGGEIIKIKLNFFCVGEQRNIFHAENSREPICFSGNQKTTKIRPLFKGYSPGNPQNGYPSPTSGSTRHAVIFLVPTAICTVVIR